MASMHQYEYLRTTLNWAKKNFPEISSDKLAKSRRPRHGYKKTNHKRETEFLIISAQNNAIRTNYIKEKYDCMQRNSKCILWGNRDEMINYISEYSLDTTWLDRWFTGNCARDRILTILPNSICTKHRLFWRMIHKILTDFEIQTDYQISATRSDLVLINLPYSRFYCPSWPLRENQIKWNDRQVLRPFPDN